MNCKIVGVRTDGSVAFESEIYPSRGWAFASASGAAVGLAHTGNPEKVHHLELRDPATNEELPNYKQHNYLVVA